jgi:predicted exporter
LDSQSFASNISQNRVLIINIIIVIYVFVYVHSRTRLGGSVTQALDSSSKGEKARGICTGYHDFIFSTGVWVATGEKSCVGDAPRGAVVADDVTGCVVESKWHLYYTISYP